MNELEHTKSELKHLQELLLEYDQELKRKNELLGNAAETKATNRNFHSVAC